MYSFLRESITFFLKRTINSSAKSQPGGLFSTELKRCCWKILLGLLSITSMQLAAQPSQNSPQSITPLAITITAVESLEPIFIGQTSVRLFGTLSLDKNYDEVYYYFEYGAGGSYTGKTIERSRNGLYASLDKVTEDIFRLTCDTTYQYRLGVRLVSIDPDTQVSTVSVVEGNDIVFQTALCNSIELFVIEAIFKDSTFVVLQNSVITGGSGLETDYYYKFGDTLELLNQTPTKTQSGSNLRFTIDGLECGKDFYFQLYAINDTGSVQSDVLTISMVVCPTLPALTDVLPKDITRNSAVFVVDVEPNGALTSASFEYGIDVNFGAMTETQKVAANNDRELLEFAVTNLQCGQDYYVSAIVSNELGSINGAIQQFKTVDCDAVILPETPEAPNSINARVFAGGFHSLAIGRSGEMVSWGDNTYGQLGGKTSGIHVVDGISYPGERVDSLIVDYSLAALGGTHTLVLYRFSGQVSAFGNNSSGQLGKDASVSQLDILTVVNDSNGIELSAIVAIAAGDQHSVAVQADGKVLVWGSNSRGQLGLSDATNIYAPQYLTGLLDVVDITAGRDFNVALMQDNSLMAWGANTSGQLGNGQFIDLSSPTPVAAVTGVRSVVAGARHVLAIDQIGNVLAWGDNSFGQLGVGHSGNLNLAEYVQISDTEILENVAKLVAGQNHSIALLNDGTVMGWGDNAKNQLGLVGAGPFLAPKVITNSAGNPLQGIVDVAAGDNFTVALDGDGNLVSWGDNTQGQLSGKPASTDARSKLQNHMDQPINMVTPRIRVSQDSITIQNGSVAHINVWLSESPLSPVRIDLESSLPNDIRFENTSELLLDVSNWTFKNDITIKADVTDNIRTGRVTLTSFGMTPVTIDLQIIQPEPEPGPQTVGAFGLPDLVFLYLMLCLRLIHKKMMKSNIRILN